MPFFKLETKPAIRRLRHLLLWGCALGVGVFLLLNALQENLVFFYTPSDFLKKKQNVNQIIRLGGVVEKGSVQQEKTQFFFVITDFKTALTVRYAGILPDLFREEQGVVVEGTWDQATQVFQASTVLAKHDETYIPREVAEGLKKIGRWKGTK